jgi:hypothetical protein
LLEIIGHRHACEEQHVNMKSKTEVMHLKPWNAKTLPANYQSLERGLESIFLLTVPRRNHPCCYLDLRLHVSRNVR